MKAILRYFAIKALSEQVSSDKKGFFQNRFVKDSLARYNFASDYVKVLETKKDNPNILGRQEFMPKFSYKGKFVIDKEHEKLIKFRAGLKSSEDPAFDRRALVDTGGVLRYAGRKHYSDGWQDVEQNSEKWDKLPAVSTAGMSIYLPALTIRNFEDVQEVLKYLEIVPYDRGTQETTAEIMGTLNEGVKLQQQEKEA